VVETSAAETVPAVVVRHLEGLIARGRLLPGARLDSERAIAAELGVSRTAVRDALARMEAAGLVERRQGSGTRISSMPPAERLLASGLQPHRTELEHSAELRRVLEPEIARLAALRAGPEELRALEDVLDRAAGCDDPDRSVQLDVEFHVAVARLTGNPLLVTMSDLTTSWTVEARLYSHLEDRGRTASIAGHRRILDALASGDGAAAAAAMREHLGEIETIIAEVVAP